MQLLVRPVAGASLLVFLGLSTRAYHGEHLLTRAELGRKTLNEYQHLVTRAWQQNPYQNETSFKYVRVLQSQGRWYQSLQALSLSASGKNHWQGWELRGIALERLAFSKTGTLVDAGKAAALYDRVLQVNPSHVKVLERRALLGLKLGNWDLVNGIAARLMEQDANNINAVYLRARTAEANGKTALAWDLYGLISANGAPSSNSWFTSREIEEKLEILKKERRR
jgi:hypothetical protein